MRIDKQQGVDLNGRRAGLEKRVYVCCRVNTTNSHEWQIETGHHLYVVQYQAVQRRAKQMPLDHLPVSWRVGRTQWRRTYH